MQRRSCDTRTKQTSKVCQKKPNVAERHAQDSTKGVADAQTLNGAYQLAHHHPFKGNSDAEKLYKHTDTNEKTHTHR